MLGDYAKTLGDVSDLRANKGRFDRTAEVTVLPRSPSKYIFPPSFCQSRLLLVTVGETTASECSREDGTPGKREHGFH